jgi:O-antigen ligase
VGHVAVLVVLIGAFALLYVDRRWFPKLSPGGMLPLIWAFILGSRPISTWLNPYEMLNEGAGGNLEGSPLDRNDYLAMIAAGIVVLVRRRVELGKFLRDNLWITLYFGYFLVSCFWSDYPFVSLKRWIKDAGHLVMIMIILTEGKPADAIKAVVVRAAYFLLPLSWVLIQWFSDLGRAYNRWTGVVTYTGVAGNKNLLGIMLAAVGICLVWAVIDAWSDRRHPQRRQQLVIYSILLLFMLWLLGKAESATALACTCIGSAIIVVVRKEGIRRRIRGLGITIATLGTLLVVTGAWSALQASAIQMLGRDPSLTGRSDIWESVLREKTNPLIGVGYYSFWTGDRLTRVSEGYYYVLNEAHNSYLETYLDGGLIGVFILAMLLATNLLRHMKYLQEGELDGGHAFGIAIGIVAAIYGCTESIFSRLDLIWFVLLLTASRYVPAAATARQALANTDTAARPRFGTIGRTPPRRQRPREETNTRRL